MKNFTALEPISDLESILNATFKSGTKQFLIPFKLCNGEYRNLKANRVLSSYFWVVFPPPWLGITLPLKENKLHSGWQTVLYGRGGAITDFKCALLSSTSNVILKRSDKHRASFQYFPRRTYTSINRSTLHIFTLSWHYFD